MVKLGRRSVRQFLQESIIKLLLENLEYDEQLEVDGIICVSVDEEESPLILRMHRLFKDRQQTATQASAGALKLSPQNNIVPGVPDQMCMPNAMEADQQQLVTPQILSVASLGNQLALGSNDLSALSSQSMTISEAMGLDAEEQSRLFGTDNGQSEISEPTTNAPMDLSLPVFPTGPTCLDSEPPSASTTPTPTSQPSSSAAEMIMPASDQTADAISTGTASQVSQMQPDAASTSEATVTMASSLGSVVLPQIQTASNPQLIVQSSPQLQMTALPGMATMPMLSGAGSVGGGAIFPTNVGMLPQARAGTLNALPVPFVAGRFLAPVAAGQVPTIFSTDQIQAAIPVPNTRLMQPTMGSVKCEQKLPGTAESSARIIECADLKPSVSSRLLMPNANSLSAGAVALQSSNMSGGAPNPVASLSSFFPNGIFKCSECDESFVQASHLSLHRTYKCLKNPYRKDLTCPLCGRAFSQPSALWRHRAYYCRVGHLKSRPRCHHCGKEFYEPTVLKKHLVRCSIRLQRYNHSQAQAQAAITEAALASFKQESQA